MGVLQSSGAASLVPVAVVGNRPPGGLAGVTLTSDQWRWTNCLTPAEWEDSTGASCLL